MLMLVELRLKHGQLGRPEHFTNQQPDEFRISMEKIPPKPHGHLVGNLSLPRHPNGCFQKSWNPQIIHVNRVFHYKPSILGTPIFGNTQIYTSWGERCLTGMFRSGPVMTPNLRPSVFAWISTNFNPCTCPNSSWFQYKYLRKFGINHHRSPCCKTKTSDKLINGEKKHSWCLQNPPVNIFSPRWHMYGYYDRSLESIHLHFMIPAFSHAFSTIKK